MKILQTTQLQNKPEAPKPNVVDTTVPTPDLEKEIVTDGALDEAAGYNDEIDNTATTIQEVVEKWVAVNAFDIADDLGTVAHYRFSDPRLQKTGMGNLMIEMQIVRTSEIPLVGIVGAQYYKFGERKVISLNLGYSERFENLPKHHQARNLKRIASDENSHTAIVHELTHAFEEARRMEKGADSIMDDKVGHLAAALRNSPIMKNIGMRIYLIGSDELNARVAEVAAIMRTMEPATTKEELIEKIKGTRIWKEIKFLKDFPADDVWLALVKRVQTQFPKEVSQGDYTAAEAKIAEIIKNALISIADDGKQKGNSKTFQQIRHVLMHKLTGDKPEYKIKGVRDILFNLEELFSKYADELKRRVLKTIVHAPKEAEPEMALAEETLAESYPEGFDMGEFRDLRNFTQRIKYCEEKLKRIKSGSSRIVYDVDGQKVLKLAKNTKGIAQNETEASYDFQNFYGDYVTKLYDSHPEDLWVEMEKANPITPGKFKQLVGVSMEELGRYLVNKFMSGSDYKEDPHLSALCDDNDFVIEIAEMVGEMELHPGDMGRASTWGLVVRNGVEMPVVVDFGITQKNFPVHYR